MEEAKELTMNNNQKRSNKSGASVNPSSTYEFPPRIALWDLKLERTKNWSWGWGYLNLKQRRQQKMQQESKRENICRHSPMGRLKHQQLR